MDLEMASWLIASLPSCRCVNTSQEQQGLDHHASLYLGGVNLFFLPADTNVRTPNFVGGIRNVVVGGVQLNPSCPAQEFNTIAGRVRTFQERKRGVPLYFLLHSL